MVSSYMQFTTFFARLAGREIRVVSKAGLPGGEAVSPAAYLLAEHANLQPGEQVSLLGAGHGAAAAALAQAQPGAALWLTDHSFIALQAAEQTLQANGVQNAKVLPGIELPEDLIVDVALLELPKGRKLVRRWLAQAFRSLRPGGRLLLAGAKDLGVQAALQDAQSLYGPGAILDYKKGSRVVQFTRPDQPPDQGWCEEPGIAPHTWMEFTLELPSPQGEPVNQPPEHLHLASLPGVFAAGRLDEGTALLLSVLPVEPGNRVLDLGCGYGIIGIDAARRGAAWTDLVDSNLLAVAAAGENLRRCRIDNAVALASDALSAVIGQRYNLIASNPPFHSGKTVDYRMAEAFIQQSREALAPGGRLVLVANRFIRYERLLAAHFSQVQMLAETRSYHVLAARQQP